MKKIVLIISFCFFTLNIEAYTLQKYTIDLNYPWGMTWLDSSQLLITEKKTGQIILFDTSDNTSKIISHEIPVAAWGQGGLLDIISEGKTIWVSCSIMKNKLLTTAVYKSTLEKDSLINSELIFEAKPYINNAKHFGSRLTIKDDYLYISVGERGKGMIAQDPTKHPGSIIRIYKDGSIPKDNPKFKSKNDWLPEIYQIGIRNPQGLTVSDFDGKVYMSNHGARGGDWFGEVKKGENYGWKILGWGGKNYSGIPIGPKWKPGFTKAIQYWVPSIATSAIVIYKGKEFEEWNGNALITSLKDQSLRKIIFNDLSNVKEQIIFKHKIGRIRDIQVHPESGKIFFLSSDALWLMEKK